MSDSDPIQRLLKAEEEAAKIVQQAKEERVKRMRQAVVESDKVCDQLREQLHKEFQSETAKKGEDDVGFVAKLKAEVDQESKEIDAGFIKNKQEVVNLLLKQVTTVSMDVPEALKQAYLTRALSERK